MECPLGSFHLLAPGTGNVELLIVAPHPDDEVIAAGGRALLCREQGVGALIVTDGARGASGTAEPGLSARRRGESLEGLRCVGARFGYFLELASAELRASPAAAAEAIRWCVQRFAPRTVVTTSPFEEHPTHRATTRAVIAALRALAAPPALLGVPVWSAVIGREGVELLDVSTVMDQKLRAVRCHESQLAARPFDEAVRCQNRLSALLAGFTGHAPHAFVEQSIDLCELVRADGPGLEQWLSLRVARWMEELRS